MPIYEYVCEACGRTFDARQKITDQPLGECTLCGRGPVRRLVSATSFVLKGSGWYKTDYANNSKKAEAGGAASGKSDADKADTGTTGSEAKTPAAA